MSFDVDVPKTFREVSAEECVSVLKNENWVYEPFDGGATFKVKWMGKRKMVAIIKKCKCYIDPDYFKPLKNYEQ